LLRDMLFVPKGKKLVLKAGQTIDLSNGASIICRDAIEINGTKQSPVNLISTDGTGDGLVVLQANSSLGRSTVNYLAADDAFDVSTSAYTVRDCTFKDIHDKCLSIGENSEAMIAGITADNAQAIIGAKDSSTIRAKNLTGKDIFIGYLAYRKKPEFGHSTAYIENMTLTGARDFDYLIDDGEIYYLDGKQNFSKGKKKEALIIEKIINEEPILR
jgi:hypothetical protein